MFFLNKEIKALISLLEALNNLVLTISKPDMNGEHNTDLRNQMISLAMKLILYITRLLNRLELKLVKEGRI